MSNSSQSDTPTVLKKIIISKWEEIASRKAITPITALQKRIEHQTVCRGFVAAIEKRVNAKQPAIIAEIKKASPSRGVIRENFHPVEIAKSYEKGGAACLSILTDVDYFQGSDDYLIAAREAVSLPVIRKDFIVDEYQVYEARAMGADCILLIAAALNSDRLHTLNDLAVQLDMDVLVEVHNAQELKLAVELPNRLIGINNRNLHDFSTSLDTTYELLKSIDKDKIIVTESGIHAEEHVDAMINYGIYAFLIGEAFMRQENPGVALQELFKRHF
jgi:indole-3-glycerol phosphate synthase